MRDIPLDSVPNQSLGVTLDENRWQLEFKEARGVMCVTISLNEVLLLSNQRLVANAPMIPYEYLQGFGGFILLTDNDDIPYWSQFGVNQQLIYASATELAPLPDSEVEWPETLPYAYNAVVINSLSIVLPGA